MIDPSQVVPAPTEQLPPNPVPDLNPVAADPHAAAPGFTPVDLDPPETADGGVDLDAKSPSQIPDEKGARKLAVKAHLGQPEDSPGVDAITHEIRAGGEDQIRQRMALARDIANRQMRMDVINGIAAQRGKEGVPLTIDDVNLVKGLSEQQLNASPKTILESEYARQYFNHQAGLRDAANVLAQGDKDYPEETHLEMDVASNIKTRQETTKTAIDKLQRKWDQTSWGEAIATHLVTFIPLLENYRLHSGKEDAILPGSNLAERVQRMWTLPPEEFQATLERDIAELEGHNPLTAMKYARAVLSFSQSDRYLNDAFGLLDATSIPGITIGKAAYNSGKAVVKATANRGLTKVNAEIVAARNAADGGKAQTIKDVKEALKDGIKADSDTEFKTAAELLEAGGDLKGSATRTVYEDKLSEFSGQDPLSSGTRLTRAVPSLFNIDYLLTGSKGLAQEVVRRFTAAMEANASDLISAVSGGMRVAGLEGDKLAAAIKLTEDKLATAYPHLNDAVLGTTHIPAEKTATNVNEVTMNLGRSDNVARKAGVLDGPAGGQRGVDGVADVEVTLGRPDATLFQERGSAEFWAENVYKLKPSTFVVKPQGGGFYIAVKASVSEVDDAVRDVVLSTRHETPKGVVNTFIGWLRTSEDTLSVAQRANRATVTHGTVEIERLAEGTAKSIGALGKKSADKLERILIANRDEVYTEKGKLRHGIFYKNIGEFDTAWMGRFKTAPTEQERIAYFSAVQLNDWDYVFRNLGLYRDKARQGIENHSFVYKATDEAGNVSVVKSQAIEGRVVKDVPWDDAKVDAGAFMYDADSGAKIFIKKNEIGQARTDAMAKVASGEYKVIQTANPIDNAAKHLDPNGNSIHFVIAKDFDRTPLDWKQISYRGGGHKEYMFGHWVKQPIVRDIAGRNHYEGDQSIFNFATEAEAKQYAERMDTARILLATGKDVELDAFLPKNLPFNSKTFRSLFSEATLPDGSKVPARLSTAHPIRHTSSSVNTVDAHPDIANMIPNFENEVRSPYNLYSNIDKKYTGERDATLGTVRERMGTGGDPIFQLEASKLIDPYAAINRGLSNVMRGRYLNDYKTQSVETFIREFGHLMKVEGGIDEIRRNPVFYLHNAPWDNTLAGTANREILAAGKNAQRAILNLIGTETDLGLNIRWIQEDLMNFIYNKGGQKASDWVAEHMLPTVSDPFRFARGIAFHSKLGLFNPVQLFLQAQTMAHVVAVAGTSAGLRGVSAAGLMRGLSLRDDKAILDHFAKMSEKMGWKAEEFKESYRAMKESGIFSVKGEVASRDDVFAQNLFKGMVGKFLDKGTFFFKEGERFARLTAWNAAYLEWKRTNPAAILDNAAKQSILLRQNLLTVNMTRASNAAWQQGLMSTSTQFLGYQARLAEQFLGKRLTTTEKARAFATYSALYGVPTAVGAVTFARPWYDDVRKAALDNGLDGNIVTDMLMQGIPATMATVITGNSQNWSQRVGPGGTPFFRDIFEDGKIGNIFGAAPNIIKDMLTAVAPVSKALVSAFVPGMGDWKYTSADAITAVQEISTLSQVGKAIYALNTGHFFSKNEVDLGPATTADAFLTLLAGTTPLEISDAFLLADLGVETAKMQREVEKVVTKNYKRALAEFDRGDDEAAARYLNNVNLQLKGAGFRPDQMSTLVKKILSENESFVDKMRKQYIQKSPGDKFDARYFRVFRVHINSQNSEEK